MGYRHNHMKLQSNMINMFKGSQLSTDVTRSQTPNFGLLPLTWGHDWTFEIIREVYNSAASPVMSMTGPNHRPTRRHPYPHMLHKRTTKIYYRQLFLLLKELPMCGTTCQAILWRLPVLRHLKGVTDTAGIKISYIFIRCPFRLGISPDSSDNDLNIMV